MKIYFKYVSILAIFISVLSTNVIAQVSNSFANETCQHFNKAYIKSYFTDTRDVFVSPYYWKGNDWIKFGSITAIGSVLYWQDENIQRWSQTLRNPTTDNIVKYGLEPWGNYYSVATITGLGLYGVIANDPKSKEVSLIATKAYVITGGYTLLSKLIFQRHRPYQDTPPDARNWEFFVHGLTDYRSFPSGHSSEAFAMAAIFASAYKDKKAVPIIAYSMASMVAMSRVYSNKHWASDVFIGSAFGFFIGKLVYKNSTK